MGAVPAPYNPPPTPHALRAPLATDDATKGRLVGQLWNDGVAVRQLANSTTNYASWLPVLTGFRPGDIGTWVGLYGMCLLRTAYTGKCLNVIRNSDSTTLDIGFLNDGTLDTASLDAFLYGTSGSVAIWYDQSGAGNNVAPPTANPTYRPHVYPTNKIGKHRSMVFDNSINAPVLINPTYFTIPTSLTVTGQAHSVMTVVRYPSTVHDQPIIQVGTSPDYAHGFFSAGNSVYVNNGSTNYAGIQPRNQPCISGYVSGPSGTNTTIYADNKVYAGNLGGNGSLVGGTIGYCPAINTHSGWSEMGAVMIAARTLSAADTLAVQASLTQMFDIRPQTLDTWVVSGDSITDGTNSISLQLYSRQAETLMKQPIGIYNVGWYGYTTVNLLSNFSVWNTPLYNAAARNNIYTLFAGTNDIYALGTSAATIYGNLTTLLNQAAALGFKTAIATILPRGLFNGTQEATRQSLNTLIRANTAGANAIIDLANDPVMGASGATSNTALYAAADTTHPTTLGYSYIAADIAAVVNSLIT